MCDQVLTLADTVTMCDVIRWCQTNARLLWMDDRGDIRQGTARSIGDDRGAFLASGADVRGSFVRITTAEGWEWFAPMADVIARHQAGTMVRES